MENIIRRELITCTICLTEYTGRIFMCINGHSVCETCRQQLTSCAICRGAFQDARNFALEEIAAAILELETTQSQVVVPTSTNQKDDFIGPLENKRNFCSGPMQGKGFFLCLFSKCRKSFPICRYLNHLRQSHESDLIEAKIDDAKYFKEFPNVSVPKGNTMTKAFNISKFGIIFLIVCKNETEGRTLNWYAWAQAIAPSPYANKIRYNLKFNFESAEAQYNSIVHGAKRKSSDIINLKQCLCYPESRGKIANITFSLKLHRGPKIHSTTTKNTS